MTGPRETDYAAERCLIGSILLDESRLDDVDGLVSPEDFASTGLAVIYQAAVDLHRAGDPVDPVTVAKVLEKRDLLAKAGGPAGIHKCIAEVPHAENATHYAGIVRAEADRRRVHAAGIDLQAAAADRSSDLAEVVAEHRKALDRVEDRGRGDEPVRLTDGLADWWDRIDEAESTQPTGFPDLDAKLNGGLRAGNLVIVAARPGVGKSALAGSIAMTVGETAEVLFVSCEMSRNELLERIVSAESGVPLWRIRNRAMTTSDRELIVGAQQRLAAGRIAIHDRAGLTVSNIAAIARRHERRHGLGLLIVDYLQLLSPEDRKANRETQVASMSRGLKVLAMQLQVPVIALAQLNRQVEQRENKRPRLSDLRESGAIEQDADIVMFLHRGHIYGEPVSEDQAELIVAKNRNGQTGTVPLEWRPTTTSYRPADAF